MIARICVGLARRAIPVHRADWLQAMLLELDHVPEPDRARFAAGCLVVAMSERMTLMTAAPPLRIVPGLFGAALLTVLCLANAFSYFSAAPVVSGFLLLASGLWLAMLFAVHAQTAQGVAKVATLGAFLYGAVGVLSLARLPAFAAQGSLLQALALEGLILFAAAFGIAQVRYFWAARDAAQ